MVENMEIREMLTPLKVKILTVFKRNKEVILRKITPKRIKILELLENSKFSFSKLIEKIII